MRIFNETKTIELTEYDLNKGYLKADKIITHIPEVPAITVEQKAKELTEQGKEVTEINGNLYEVLTKNEYGQTVNAIRETPAVPAHDEDEHIQVYVPYTAEEIEKLKAEKYPVLVERFIREKYTLSAEIAVLRQRDTKPEEFNEYNAYAETCKERAKAEIYGGAV